MDFQNSVLLVVSAIAGLAGMPVISLLKKLFNVDGKAALGIATIASLVLAIASLFISRQFVGVEFDLQTIGDAFGVVFAMATLFYKALQADGVRKPPMQG